VFEVPTFCVYFLNYLLLRLLFSFSVFIAMSPLKGATKFVLIFQLMFIACFWSLQRWWLSPICFNWLPRVQPPFAQVRKTPTSLRHFLLYLLLSPVLCTTRQQEPPPILICLYATSTIIATIATFWSFHLSLFCVNYMCCDLLSVSYLRIPCLCSERFVVGKKSQFSLLYH